MRKKYKQATALLSSIIVIAIFISEILASQPAEVSAPVLGVTDDRGFESVLVTRVVDGDTIELSDGRKVRYIGINTPETKHPTKGKECFGEAASARNRELVENQTVWLETDVSDTDRYGRLLRYIWVNEQLLNHQLVLEGFAFASSFPPDVAHQELFAEAEQIARENEHGLWASCPLNDVDEINATIEEIDQLL
jgi:micrococcal nuclease